MTTRCRLRIRAKRRQTVELFHDLFEFVLSPLQIKMTTDDGILAREINDLFAVKVV
jgi:hypothetical protein